MTMMSAIDPREASALYAGFAAAFRYPEEGGWLSGPEFLEAFDPGVTADATSLNEASSAGIETSALFEELVRFYEHFGLRRLEKAGLPDHLGVELDFMHFLCELQQAAEARGEDVGAVTTAQRDFLDRHVLRLLAGVHGQRKESEDKASHLVRECRDFVESHREALAQ